MHRVIERILNLLAFLLTVDRPVTADEIRNTVAGYDQDTDEAFRRTFERDKTLLKSLGVPLKMEFTDAWKVEQGYVVSADEYALEDPGLTDEERAALWFATRMARLGGSTSATSAIFKLGGAAMESSGEPLAADLEADPEVLALLFGAVTDRRRVGFDYRGRRRRIEPLGLVHRMGHWYLVARSEEEIRTYRVDRMAKVAGFGEEGAFERPEGFRARDAVPAEPWEAGEERIDAVVVFDASIAWWARRQVGPRADVEERRDGSLRVTLPVASPDAFIGWILGFDDAAVIESPPELRDRLVAHLGAA